MDPGSNLAVIMFVSKIRFLYSYAQQNELKESDFEAKTVATSLLALLARG